ncbi:MAG: response regulator [Dehalococcoidales bacterium]|nr:response regulator [Dehalococcoidales bacterium]
MTRPRIHKKRILIVDDEPAICQFCQRVLAEEGFEVDTSANGEAARSLVGKQEYALFLFDIKMPLMDGRELYRWLADAYPRSIEKVIFMTGSAIGQETESFLKNTGSPVLLKPFTSEELKQQINLELKD